MLTAQSALWCCSSPLGASSQPAWHLISTPCREFFPACTSWHWMPHSTAGEWSCFLVFMCIIPPSVRAGFKETGRDFWFLLSGRKTPPNISPVQSLLRVFNLFFSFCAAHSQVFQIHLITSHARLIMCNVSFCPASQACLNLHTEIHRNSVHMCKNTNSKISFSLCFWAWTILLKATLC